MFLQKGIPGRFTAKSGIRELFLEHDLALRFNTEFKGDRPADFLILRYFFA